jgi:hypothetical protein
MRVFACEVFVIKTTKIVSKIKTWPGILARAWWTLFIKTREWIGVPD